MKTAKSITTFFLVLLLGTVLSAAEIIHFDFEGSKEEWKIPDWAFYQSDHVGRASEISQEEFSSGEHSLKVDCEFPGDVWRAVIIDRVKDVDLSEYNKISVDIYLPRKAPRLLQARLIITAGDGWHFVEMREAIPLRPGKWSHIEALVEKDPEGPTDWKGLSLHLKKIKKIAVRIEYDAAPPHKVGRKYHGPIYIDNIIIE